MCQRDNNLTIEQAQRHVGGLRMAPKQRFLLVQLKLILIRNI